MEPRLLLSAGIGGSVSLTPSAIRRRLTETGPDRGDHDLNPGMAPADRMRAAAVLVPLVARREGTTVLLTRRTEHLHHHAGQISFPGGRIEEYDPSPEDAALRETEEEIGLGRSHIELVGRLGVYRTRTGFEITPVVGWVTPPFDLWPDRFEVAEVFEVPLSFIADPRNHERHSREWQGVVRHFYVLPYGGYYIWGATAGMLVNLAERLKP
jgi:8-oxo-dGTP pyrophosphatase MutT (NUDIX family)